MKPQAKAMGFLPNQPTNQPKAIMQKQMIKPLLGASAFAAMLFAGAPQASAVSYGFYNLTNNNPGVNPDLTSQLIVDVTVSAGSVSFKFSNDVGFNSDIAEIYFDDGMLGNPAIIDDSDGTSNDASQTSVKYVTTGNGKVLPGGENAMIGEVKTPFVVDQAFSAYADNPAPKHAVDATGEWVTLTFGLGTFADLTDVTKALDSGDLRIGLHMTGFANGSSDSYVTVSKGTEGEPFKSPDGGSTIALLGVAVFGVDFLRRRMVKA